MARAVEAWHQGDHARLLDTEKGPLADMAGNLVIVERDANGDFTYLYYGKAVAAAAGLQMVGKSTADFETGVGAFFAQSYREAIAVNAPYYAVNKSKMTHHTHSWERLLLPVLGENAADQPKLIAVVAPVATVADILADFARDNGFLGGSLEPIIDNEAIVDFAVLTLAAPSRVPGLTNVTKLSQLYGRPLEMCEIDRIINAADGQNAVSRGLPDSVERFGRDFFLSITGASKQPVFSVSDISDLMKVRRQSEERKMQMEQFATIASDWMWETDQNNVFTLMTEAVEAVSGRPASYFIGKSRFQYAPYPENDAVFAKYAEDVAAHRRFSGMVYRVETPEGETRWLRVNGMPRFGPNGTFIGYRGTGSNVTEEVEAKRALENTNRAMADFAKTGSDWMWESDTDHKMVWITEAVERYSGQPPEHYIGKSRFSFADLADNAEVFARHAEDLEARKPFKDLTYCIEARDGTIRWFRVSGVPRYDAQGVFAGYRGTGADITAEVEAREQAARRAKDLAEAHRLGRMGAWTLDVRSRNVQLNPEYLELVGLSPEQCTMGLDEALSCFCSTSQKTILAAYKNVRHDKIEQQLDVSWTATKGAPMDMLVIAKPRLDEKGRVREVFGTVQDITHRKQSERDLEALAFHDPLTGLGNRTYFSRDLDVLLASKTRNGENAGLMLLDLDHFKEVNDTLGHAAGDELLRRVSERLSMAVAGQGTVYRLGGDEFAILVPSITYAAELGALSTSVIHAFNTPVTLNDSSVNISTSIGMVLVPSQTNDGEEGMRFADLALYEAKAEGRGRALLFHTGLDQKVQERVNLARDLVEGLKRDELEAHYQLQVDVIKGNVCGFEGLARWTHPTRGVVPPSKFIPIAESSRLIADLGAWMVGRVCREGRAWLDAGGAPLEMSVNLSVAQLWHRDVEGDIKSALDNSGFPPELLCLELTESVFSDEAMPRIRRLTNSLKGAGVKIALDDFGTGYSSLQYLNQLSFDKLKIDRSFVTHCDSDREKMRLLQGIVGLGKGLGLGLIVEGVENERELQIVCDLGCQVVQGYFFAKPKPFHEACLDAAQIESEYGFNPVLWKDREPINPDAPFMKRVAARLEQLRKPPTDRSKRRAV